MSRLPTLTQRIRTRFGTLYSHVAFDPMGCPVEVWFSTPGKFSETEVGEALNSLADAVNEMIKEAK